MTIIPFILSLIAGLSTLIGALSINIKYNQNKIIKNSLALAAGSMVCISIIELIPESINLLIKHSSKNKTYIIILLFSILGNIICNIISKIMSKNKKSLYRVGVISMIAIIVHNIPEGIATFLSASSNIKLGLSITISIALHNIPEGISIAIPIYYSTKDKKQAILMTTIAALSEPFGALIAHLLLKPIITDQIMGCIYALITGIMINISITELLPNAFKYKNKRGTIIAFIIGIILMYLSVVLI